MCRGLVLGLLAQARMCPHCQEAVQGDILLWKRGQGQRQKIEKLRKMWLLVTMTVILIIPLCCSWKRSGSRHPQALPWGFYGLQTTYGVIAGVARDISRQALVMTLPLPTDVLGPWHAWILTPSPSKAWVPLEQGSPQCIFHPSFWASHHKMEAVGRNCWRSSWDSDHQPLPGLLIFF